MAFEMKSAHEIIKRLAKQNRVLVLGGIAVIAHGLPRATQDVDVWVDPLHDTHAWATALRRVLEFEGLTAAHVVGEGGIFAAIKPAEIERVVAEDHFVRLLGANRPIDVFRMPRNFEAGDFNQVWQRARPLRDGTRVPDEIDIILTKINTGRPHDEADTRYLESKVVASYQEQLKHCPFEEARRLLDRFATPEIVAFAATEAQDPRVREISEGILLQMIGAGDPYASELAVDIRRRKARAIDRGDSGR